MSAALVEEPMLLGLDEPIEVPCVYGDEMRAVVMIACRKGDPDPHGMCADHYGYLCSVAAIHKKAGTQFRCLVCGDGGTEVEDLFTVVPL